MKTPINKAEIVQTGSWGGEPIWRYKTAEEKLLVELNKNMAHKKQKSDLELENEQVQFIEANEKWLSDYFYSNNLATTDEPDEFENWMSDIGNEEAIRIIKAEMKKEEFAIAGTE